MTYQTVFWEAQTGSVLENFGERVGDIGAESWDLLVILPTQSLYIFVYSDTLIK